MTKITLNDVISLQNEGSALLTINDNYDTIVEAFDNTVSRDGSIPNEMESNLDMNLFQILNLPVPATDQSPIRKIDLTNVSHTTSSTSNTISLGTKTFTVPSALGFFPGQYLLIQVASDTSKYILCRVVSYGSISLVVTALSIAGTGTFSNWVIDLSGPMGPPVTIYDTVSNAIAASIDPTVSFLSLSGYYTVGDGGNGLYQRVSSQPIDAGKFQSADGAWWHLISRAVTPEMFGCKGDGSTNNLTNMQNCFNFVTTRGGGVVDFTPNKEYLIQIRTPLTTSGLTVSNGVVLNLNGSKISLDCDGQVYGVRPMNHTRIFGPGTIACTVSTGLGDFGTDSAIYHAPISMGCTYGDCGTVASKSPYAEVFDWVIEGVTFTSVRNNGQGSLIQGFGGMHHGVIRGNNFPDQATIALAIDFDWAFYGLLQSSDLNLSKTNYLAGTAYSIHPHQIVIENNYIGNLTMPIYGVGTGNPFGSHGIRLSGCYDMKVLNNSIEQVTFAGIFITGGDLSFEYAPTAIRLNAMKNYEVRGNNLKNCNTYSGIVFDAFPDNVYAAVQAATYTPMYIVDGYHNNLVISENKINTFGTTSVKPGIQLSFTRGGSVCDNVIQGFDQGIWVSTLCKNISVERNDISICNKAGIIVHDTTEVNFPENTLVRHNYSYTNCTSGSTQGNIYIGTASMTIVDANQIGVPSEDQSIYGIVVDGNVTNSVFTTVTNNFVYEVKTGGTAYRFVNTTSTTPIWAFRDNRYATGVNTYLTGPNIMPIRRSYSTSLPGSLITHAEALRSAMTTDTTPTFGTWESGSTITMIDSATTGQGWLSKCTATGAPGTWKLITTIP